MKLNYLHLLLVLNLNNMKILAKIILFFFLLTSQVHATSNATKWLKLEIDNILLAYQNDNISTVKRFEYIENTIDQNFAGAGIAKFVAGKAWSLADKETKKTYIKLFKRHLALNIAAMMQGYSKQTYAFIDTKVDKANNVYMIDMEVQDKVNKLLITWRVKESKERFYVIDMLVSDISLVRTKRSEFNSVLKKIDYDLKDFNAKLYKQNESSYNKLTQ